METRNTRREHDHSENGRSWREERVEWDQGRYQLPQPLNPNRPSVMLEDATVYGRTWSGSVFILPTSPPIATEKSERAGAAQP